MNDPINIIQKLAVKNVTPSNFQNPIEYLTWFLENTGMVYGILKDSK